MAHDEAMPRVANWAGNGDSSSGRADDTSENDTTCPSPAEGTTPPVPDEEEVLSRAAAALLGGDAPGQTQQEVQDPTGAPIVTMARAYQLEMCEESMKRNIIAVVCAGL